MFTFVAPTCFYVRTNVHTPYLRVSVVDRHRFDSNPDPDPTFHFDADPDPDPDPAPDFTQVS